MLKFKELPYLFTILFAVLGYTVKELSEEMLETTFIEYEFDKGQTKRGKFVSYSIYNISRKDSYKNLAFTLKRHRDDTLGSFILGVMNAKKPVFEQSETILNLKDAFAIGESYAHFKIPHLIPGSTYELKVYYNGKFNYRPELLFHIRNMLKINSEYDFSKPPVYLKKAGISTWLAKNKIGIYILLILLWIILIIIYAKFMSKSNDDSSTPAVN